MANKLFKSFKADKWPFKLNDLPDGSVLVGGAVRNKLLNKSDSTSDLDFVVPHYATKTCKNFASKYGGTVVELDPQRDIARFVFDDWKIVP